MNLQDVVLHNCRKIEKASLTLSPCINIIIGENASGKTSIIEGLSILSRGRSFHTHRISEVISWGTKKLLVTATLVDLEKTSHVGVEKSTDTTRIRIDQTDIRSQSELSQHIPITIIYPNSIKLIMGSPTERRAYLDWIGFYLQPAFHQQWKYHQRVIKQRNSYLRTQQIGNDFEFWTKELIKAQAALHQSRMKILESLEVDIEFFRQFLFPINSIGLSLSNGFSKAESFIEMNNLEFYKSKLDQDLKLKRTTYGAHKSDLLISFDGNPAHIAASRGQLKMLAILLLLAQSKVINQRNQQKGVIIIDDMTSELDLNNQAVVITTLGKLEQQIILTAPTMTELLSKQDAKMFHVKHGEIQESLV